MIAGLDVSLRGTAVCRILRDRERDSYPIKDPVVIRSKPAGMRVFDRQDRLRSICRAVFSSLFDVDLLLIEAPAFASQTGSMHDRSGLWWLLVDAAVRDGMDVVEVAPSLLKKYATGKGDAGKAQMIGAAIRRFPAVEILDDNAADALLLATLGAHAFRGVELAPVPVRALEAVGTLRAANSGLVPPALRAAV